MPAPSLLQLSTATAIRNVKLLNDIGNLPYALARPFLLKIESPEKLRSLEILSPHLIKDDDELWLEFIKRDIPKWNEYELPEKSDNWYDIYCNLREEVQRAVDEDAERMKMALDGINSERAKHSAKFVTDRRLLPLPRERPTAKQRYASYDRRMGGITPVFSSPRSGLAASDTPRWSFERPSLPRDSGSKKKSSIFTAPKRNTALAVPTKHLNNRATQVRQAPRSLVEEHRRPAEHEVAASRRKDQLAMRAPGRLRAPLSGSKPQEGLAMTPSLQEREARLRAIASGTQPKPLSSSPDPSRNPSQMSQAGTSNPKNASASSPARGSAETKTQSYIQSPKRERSSSAEPQVNAETDTSKSPQAQQPRPAMVRKRPAPNVFIQPRKKRLT